MRREGKQGTRNKKKTKVMYTTAILQYLIWPVFIVVNWFVIDRALRYYGKKFPGLD